MPLNLTSKKDNTSAANRRATVRFEAIVIGSGTSGGWAAKGLTQKDYVR